jgi:hypothetical protein
MDMEVNLREKMHLPKITGMLRNIKTIILNQPRFPQNTIAAIGGYPHGKSREYTVQALNIEMRKAKALAEAQRRLRIL